MNRVVRSNSGKQIYGQKWQNVEGGKEIESDEGLHSASVESTETTMGTNVVQRNRRGSLSDRQSAMYKAALEGDWLAAEMLLERNPSLARDEITERGDRALHVAANMKHKVLVRELVERMSPSDLELHDGHGYTAFCYAAISGKVEIADVMMKKNPNMVTARDNINGTTPLHKAALHENKDMVSYLLKSAKVEDFSREEWFDLLQITIGNKMYGTALEILEKNGSVAAMRNQKGLTALHLLAQHETSEDHVDVAKGLVFIRSLFGKEPPLKLFPIIRRRLAKKLWAEIQRLEPATALELMKNPPILHDAAKVGNVELITMLTCTYPDLIWEIDDNKHTIFHIAVMYRQEKVFNLFHQLGAMKNLIAISQDKNENNILHLAAESMPRNTTKIIPAESALQMQREIIWFKKVRAIVPPSCHTMRNKFGHTPRTLFKTQHKSLLEKSETWMRNIADSCMLIATIMLTVVFAAPFTVPGGNDQEFGIPIHLKSNWFTCFVIFGALALCGSTVSIMMFWSIMTSNFEEGEFQEKLLKHLKFGLSGLFVSIFGAITAFVSAYFLVFVGERGALVKTVILFFFIVLMLLIFHEFFNLLFDMQQTRNLQLMLSRPSGHHSLFSSLDTATRKK